MQIICLNRRQKNILNYIVGPLLFIWLSYSIYRQVNRQVDVQQSWNLILAAFNGEHQLKLIAVMALMFVNWGIEARKWQLQVKGIEAISFLSAFRAILAGQALGFNTINRIGESAGRVVFLKEGNRIRGVVLSFVGSMAQIIVTFTLGVCFLLYLRIFLLNNTTQLNGLSAFWLDGLIYVIASGIILFTLAYFKLAGLINLLEKIPIVSKYRFFIEKLEDFHWRELIRILSLSLGRYFIFLIQYVLLFDVFNVPIFWLDAIALVGVLLLVLAIVPSIALAEIGVRGKVSLLLFGLVSSNTIGIIATAGGIWLINLILPAIGGTLFILSIRLFRKKNKID